MRRQNGITLIALVITIIVLLILAGISISAIVGENGIAGKAKDAKEETIVADDKEKINLTLAEYELEELEENPPTLEELFESKEWCEDAELDGSTMKLTVKMANGREYEIDVDEEPNSQDEPEDSPVLEPDPTLPLEKLEVGTEVTGSNRTLTGGTATYKNPIIPVGFKAVNDGASWTISGEEITGWNDGLVIEDGNGNQFVWVPVDGTNVPYAKWRYDITYEYVTGDDVVSGVTETDQITKYKGFWIGRYEAGRSNVDSATTTTNNVTTGVDLLIQKGAQPWNLISYTNAKTVAEGYKNNANVKSGLVTGTQWDATMKWVENAGFDVTTDSTEWGNYYNNTAVAGNGRYSTAKNNLAHAWQTGAFSKTENSTLFTGTGLYEDSKAKNIYDLAGNVWEWTAEQCSIHIVNRGGNAYEKGGSYPAGVRAYSSVSITHYSVGFRVVLYVM